MLEECSLIGTFNSGFILFKDGSDIFIGDQHAIHERIRLEMLSSAFCGDEETAVYGPDKEFVEEYRKNGKYDLEHFKQRACKGINPFPVSILLS